MLDKAFELKEILLNNTAGILSGAIDPNIAYPLAPLGSIYLKGDGSAYLFTDNGWSVIGISNARPLEELTVFFNGDYELLFIDDALAKVEI